MTLKVRKILSDQRSRYLIVGGINTAFGFVFFTLVYYLIEGKTHYLVIFLFSQIISICFSHATQRRFVWYSNSNYRVELAKFFSAYLVATSINVVLLTASQEIFRTPIVLSQFIIGIGIIILMYYVQKNWTFSKNNND
jgi:putative flippase GtrA